VWAIVLWMVNGTRVALAANPIFSYISFVLLFVTTVALVDSERRLRLILLVDIGSVALASLYVIREWQKFHNVYVDFRPGFITGDPNYFAVSGVLTIPLAFFLGRHARRAWQRFYCYGCLLVSIIAVILSASRGGFLGLVTAVLYGVAHSEQKLRNTLLICSLLLPAVIFAPSSPVQRLLHPSQGDSVSVDARTVLWRAGLSMIRRHPMTGIGLGRFKENVPDYAETDMHRIAHNSYIELGAELGLPALVAFAGVLFAALSSLGKFRRQLAKTSHQFLAASGLGLQTGLLGAAVAIFFVSGEYQKLLWLTVFLSILFPFFVEQALADEEQTRLMEAMPNGN
jgi:O-antigen ligase